MNKKLARAFYVKGVMDGAKTATKTTIPANHKVFIDNVNDYLEEVMDCLGEEELSEFESLISKMQKPPF